MPKKNTLREQRRQVREARKRKQQLMYGLFGGFVVIFIVSAFVIRWSQEASQKRTNAAASTAQVATNTIYTATAAVLQTANAAKQATFNAFSASVVPMTFAGIPTDTVTTASGLQYKDLVIGTGTEIRNGDDILVHYTGWLTDGTEFDSSVPRGEPFNFTLGAGGVIKGWDEGVAGMKVGGRRILIIPPNLGYGPQASGKIPANSTLIFEIVLLLVQ